MYRIRFHGRGGQGIKTASRILGSAFFVEGFEVQDAPRYGAERRGAPIFAYVRADRAPVFERGPIDRPDLVLVADETLMQVSGAGVLTGIRDETVLVIVTTEPADVWSERLSLSSTILTLPPEPEEGAALTGTASVGAAARLLGEISPLSLEESIRSELADLDAVVVERNVERALESYDSLEDHAGCVSQGQSPNSTSVGPPDWVTLEVEPASLAAPDVRGSATSESVPTGLWRTARPVIDDALCNRCSWICSTLCPDGAIDVGSDRAPSIDYDHCKGCLLCVAVCPPHAIRVEREVASGDSGRGA
jgi:pyruvate ferredoxin oxidoreductase gamma subunit